MFCNKLLSSTICCCLNLITWKQLYLAPGTLAHDVIFLRVVQIVR